MWKNYKFLFDNKVDPETTEPINISYMRAVLTIAGPIKNGNKRYDDIKDRLEE